MYVKDTNDTDNPVGQQFSMLTNPVVNDLIIQTNNLEEGSTWEYQVIDARGALV